MRPDQDDQKLRREMSRVGGVLYASGGLLVLASVLTEGEHLAAPTATAAVAFGAIAAGVGLWLVGERIPIPPAFHAVSSVLGSIVVSVIVVFGGPFTAGLFGIFYVYVAAFAFYYFSLPLAVVEVVLAGVGYGIALAIVELEGALGAWLVAMGASIAAGALIGSLGHRQRDLARTEQERATALAAYDAARATLLRIVSHDLRGPLSTIAMSAQTILDEGHRLAPELREELLRTQRRQADRLLRLVSDILDSERLREGSLQPTREEVKLQQLVENVVSSMSVDPSQVVVTGDALVRADPLFVERAVENLVSNAIRHGPGREPVEVSIGRVDGRVEIAVADRGPGVPDHQKETIFEAFVSHDGAHRSPGLGLSVTRALVRAHGGDVLVRDRPGGGALFVLTLPEGEGSARPEGNGPSRHGDASGAIDVDQDR